jgi:predicted dehydrogenase
VSRRLGIAIIGCGAVTRLVRVPVYARLASLARVVGVCDVDLDRAREVAAQFGPAEPAIHRRLEEVLSDPSVEAVDVCTPHAAHAGPALEALRAGRHVIVEKPIAARFEDALRMVEAARAAGRVLAVNEQIGFGAGLRRARELLLAGALGELVSVRAHRLFLLPPAYAGSGWRNDPRAEAAGVLIDQGPHYVHLLRRLAGGVAGEITHAQAVADGPRAPTALVHVRYASGLLGELLLSWRVPTPPTAAVGYAFGTDGDLEVDGPEGGLVWHRPAALGPSAVGVPGVLVAREAHLVAVEACIADFVRAAAATGAAEMSGAEGLRDLAVVDAALRSVASGRMEPVAHV